MAIYTNLMNLRYILEATKGNSGLHPMKPLRQRVHHPHRTQGGGGWGLPLRRPHPHDFAGASTSLKVPIHRSQHKKYNP